MKRLRIPPHTLTNLRDREIAIAEVQLAIERPERIVAGYDLRKIYLRRYLDSIVNEEMLLRVIVEETETELVVVTAYKTSKLAKYLKEGE